MRSLLAAIVAAAQAVGAPPPPAPPLPALALDPRWDVPLDADAAAPPGYDDTTAYVPLKTGALVAIDLDSGEVRWRRTVATAFAPEPGDGRIYVASGASLAALDARTGGEIWSVPLTGEAAAPPYSDTGWVLASTAAGDLLGYRGSDGVQIWRQALGAPLATRPAPALDRVYLALTDGRLVAAALDTGALVWQRTVPGRVTGLRALDDQLVAGTSEDEVYSFDLNRGRQRWRWRVGGDVSGAPAFDHRAIFFAARDNVLRAVDRRSGNLRWTANLLSRPIAGPTILGGVVLVPFAGEVAAFDPATGKAVTSIPSSGEIGAAPYVRASPRQTAPRLITISRDGHLQGFGLRFEPRPAPLAELPGAAAVP